MPTATLPTAPKRREYPVRRPLRRATLHPGTLMREILEGHVKIPIAEAARRMKVSRPALYAVLNGTAAMTAEMAVRFARLTGGAPELYLNMQTGHDLEVAQQRLQGELADIEVSLTDATLEAVQAHGEGATASEVLNYLSREFGMTVRPSHLGMGLQRHRRAGRLENRDQRWYLPHSAQAKQSA